MVNNLSTAVDNSSCLQRKSLGQLFFSLILPILTHLFTKDIHYLFTGIHRNIFFSLIFISRYCVILLIYLQDIELSPLLSTPVDNFSPIIPLYPHIFLYNLYLSPVLCINIIFSLLLDFLLFLQANFHKRLYNNVV